MSLPKNNIYVIKFIDWSILFLEDTIDMGNGFESPRGELPKKPRRGTVFQHTFMIIGSFLFFKTPPRHWTVRKIHII
jgi:hypothetical protein